jgi:hypothetical protein
MKTFGRRLEHTALITDIANALANLAELFRL